MNQRLESPDDVPTLPGQVSDTFSAKALVRISRLMIVIAVMFGAMAWLRFGWRIAAGFVGGCTVSYLSFHWLKQVVNALADRITLSGRPQSSTGVVARFLLRYCLMAVAAYGILSVSSASLNGFFAGLFLPVAAILCEAVYEGYAAIARSNLIH